MPSEDAMAERTVPAGDGGAWGTYIKYLDRLEAVAKAAKYVLDAEDTGHPGHNPMARLREAFDELVTSPSTPHRMRFDR